MSPADKDVHVSFPDKLQYSKQMLMKTFQDYKPSEVFLSFNGGKDCTVLLHFVVELFRELKIDSKQLICVHVQPSNPFDEVEQFVRDCEVKYNVSIKSVQGSIKETLFKLCTEESNLKACIMGCRRTDPYCSDLNVFQSTDTDWPPLMRINPLLDWNHSDIWQYLRSFQVPYCILYNVGYTSLGDKMNTIPNPHLKITNSISNKQDEYKPAWELENADEFERAGRIVIKR